MCGVRLERRKSDRRVNETGAHLKCESCGNVNDVGYKFCGMCGNRVDRRLADRRGGAALHQARTDAGGNVAVAIPSTAVHEAEHVPPRSPEPVLHHTTAPVYQRSHADDAFHSEPVTKSGIQGPSFLGLSDDSDDDGSYLLEEENTSRSGLRKLVLLVILAAIAGLIFVQYRSSLHANPKPAPAQSGPQGQTQQPAAISGGTANPQIAGPNLAAGQTQPNAQQPSTADTPSTAAASSQPADPPPQVTPVKADGPEIDPANLAEKSDPAISGDKTDKHDDPGTGKSLDPTVPAEQKPSAALIRAQQFLLGKGVEQNCEQGLLYLRAAAQKNEPAAAVQMGALYASGHCVHQDRVMAYRWFNSAHELQPANQWIQRNMDLLWGQMTDQERRLAGY